MRTYHVTVGWGCLGLAMGAAVVVVAVAVQVLVAVGAALLAVISRG